MSGILSTITGALGRLFENLLPSWGDPMPPELPKPSKPPVPEEDEEGESDYVTALAYQNIDTRYRAFWPIGPGEFRTFSHISMDPISYNLEYGIYCANIEGQPVDHKCTKTFCYNPTGYYTHYDLQLAKNLGLHIELSSKSPNALIFGQDQLRSGHNTFY
ncbi:18624_t:CDS:2 [Dentiscutata erythropus]|uniref:18624_t:CDS:1 n=1 Tax=Dentiscutata erythropus TaxID=1348616 RepID=A0A9N9NVX8_9GLOM|nr:18624_t:CDS:2 [Dentiscutata erythropus]